MKGSSSRPEKFKVEGGGGGGGRGCEGFLGKRKGVGGGGCNQTDAAAGWLLGWFP